MRKDKKTQWYTEGLKQVIEVGFEGFNVDVLCSDVGVAKTSFYHFFISRERFLEALLTYWSSTLFLETIQSIQRSTELASVNAFIRHKKDHIAFYCFFIQAKLFVENKENLSKIVHQVEQEVWECTKDFVDSLNGKHGLNSQTELLLRTFLSGWDYLNAFNINKNNSEGKRATADLKKFLLSFKEDSESQLLAS